MGSAKDNFEANIGNLWDERLQEIKPTLETYLGTRRLELGLQELYGKKYRENQLGGFLNTLGHKSMPYQNKYYKHVADNLKGKGRKNQHYLDPQILALDLAEVFRCAAASMMGWNEDTLLSNEVVNQFYKNISDAIKMNKEAASQSKDPLGDALEHRLPSIWPSVMQFLLFIEKMTRTPFGVMADD